MVIIHAGVNVIENSDFSYNSLLEQYRFAVIVFKSYAEVFLDDSYVQIEPGTAVMWRGEDRMIYRAGEGRAFIHDFAYFGYSETGVNFFNYFPVRTPIKLLNTEEMSRILQMIINEAKLKMEFHSDVIIHLNFLYLFSLKREIELQSKIPDNRSHYNKLYTLRNHIYAEPDNDWTVQTMSNAVHLSESYFQHLYKLYFGESCIKDVTRARIAAAKKMLRHTDMKISRISEKCGYKNVEHFTRQFKGETGKTPGKYRET